MFSILVISNKYFLLFNTFVEYSVEKAHGNSWKFITWMFCDFYFPRSTEKTLNKNQNRYWIIRGSEQVGYKDVNIFSNFLGGLFVFSLHPWELFFLSAFVNNDETRISLTLQSFFSKATNIFVDPIFLFNYFISFLFYHVFS